MSTNYKSIAIYRKYPELVHMDDQNADGDYYICNEGETGKNPEIFIWNTEKYPKPTDEEMQQWFNEFSYLDLRRYDAIEEQLDRLTHDIEAGLFGEDAKTGQFYLGNKAVKDSAPKQ